MENPVIELGDDPWSSESLRMDDSVFVYIRGSSPKSSAGEDERFDASRCCRKTIETLCDHLVLQLPAKGLSQKERVAFRYMAQSIDPNGYLDLEPEELSGLFGLTQDKAEGLMTLLRQMDPVGVGAHDLRDCLLIQLEKEHPENALARRIATDWLELLSKNQLSAIAGKCGADLASVKAAAELIRSLDPRPAGRFFETDAPYIIPDVSVEKVDCGYILKSNQQSQICLNIDEG